MMTIMQTNLPNQPVLQGLAVAWMEDKDGGDKGEHCTKTVVSPFKVASTLNKHDKIANTLILHMSNYYIRIY